MRPKVLVIDDEVAMRRSFQLTLRGFPYDVEVAESAEEGLRELESTGYDLVFLDLHMPGLDGVETLRRLRARDAKLAVYIVTAFHADHFDALKSAAGEGLDFELLHKPLNADQIREVTAAALGGERAGGEDQP